MKVLLNSFHELCMYMDIIKTCLHSATLMFFLVLKNSPGCHRKLLKNKKNLKARQWKHQSQFDITNHELPNFDRNLSKMVVKF